ncbi:MAG TPA: potassium-transporting ATPase subunit KdpC [Pseudobdellovibrionaceae bacterium]|jgi:K+-transporting ATPase ATPase C chain
MKYFLPSLRMLLFMTVLTGMIYPLAITGISQILFKEKANGQIISKNGISIGSELIAQKFESERYFWPRPSGVDFNSLPSGGSNLGQASSGLKKAVDERFQKLKSAHPDAGEPPQDLLFASGSGLDPHISPEAARYQVARVAKARVMQIEDLVALVDKVTEGRQWGILGEPRVNVLKLNLILDQIKQ